MQCYLQSRISDSRINFEQDQKEANDKGEVVQLFYDNKLKDNQDYE